ncbi:uncharacterized protein ALTATR162_LOCUS10888 [Alternaria atra]|jgi:hypothetical protein|uniref:Uncharacterized protein n=1 Tax=Alternaria atra TaxID=119953 RepID=A0A8J2IAB7_9PLEO|nr:uncharacterized protein ALTATR162_LOCUS7863 [Alternaria atra]XP_043174463.1 uncharacterized protein ALTATR162_LOCUS10888 [Alternaria atra]CAG5174781.1 unnamed protein product [Alternaria atra]CAG5184057.1 unnamed protein product [Alternaria atra]
MPLSLIKHEATSPPLTLAQIPDYGLSAFLEDDEEITTQLSQQPPKAELEDDILEDVIQDDEEISTLLTQEWHDTDQEVFPYTKTPNE